MLLALSLLVSSPAMSENKNYEYIMPKSAKIMRERKKFPRMIHYVKVNGAFVALTGGDLRASFLSFFLSFERIFHTHTKKKFFNSSQKNFS